MIEPKNLKRQRCLVLGDIMIDRYLEGRINRVSPEAPVPILDYKSSEDRLGGAANVALNLKAFNCEIYMASVCGNDEDGLFLKESLVTSGIDSTCVVLSNHRRTTLKTRLISDRQQLMRVDQEVQYDLLHEEVELLKTEILKIVDQVDLDFIILEDYNKGVLSEEIIRWIIAIAQEKNINVFVDPKKKNFFAYQGVTVFKPNLRELKDAYGLAEIEASVENLSHVADRLLERLKCTGVLITLGEKGVFYKTEDNHYFIEGIAIDISDVCGAGDTVISSFAALYDQVPIEENLEFSNFAAAQVCRLPGVVPFDLDFLTKS